MLELSKLSRRPATVALASLVSSSISKVVHDCHHPVLIAGGKIRVYSHYMKPSLVQAGCTEQATCWSTQRDGLAGLRQRLPLDAAVIVQGLGDLHRDLATAGGLLSPPRNVVRPNAAALIADAAHKYGKVRLQNISQCKLGICSMKRLEDFHNVTFPVLPNLYAPF